MLTKDYLPSSQKNSLKECVFFNSALKNTLLQTAFSAILPTGKRSLTLLMFFYNNHHKNSLQMKCAFSFICANFLLRFWDSVNRVTSLSAVKLLLTLVMYSKSTTYSGNTKSLSNTYQIHFLALQSQYSEVGNAEVEEDNRWDFLVLVGQVEDGCFLVRYTDW